ncbi:MAG: hypothetical protein ACR2QO_00785 [Acidimicrobiales bacterium]
MEVEVRVGGAELGGRLDGEIRLEDGGGFRSGTVSLVRSIKIPRDFTHTKQTVAKTSLDSGESDGEGWCRFSLPVPRDELRTCSTTTTAIAWHVEAKLKRGLLRSAGARQAIEVSGDVRARFDRWQGQLKGRSDTSVDIQPAEADVIVRLAGASFPIEVGVQTSSWHDETIKHGTRRVSPHATGPGHLTTVTTMHIDQRWPEAERWIQVLGPDPVRISLEGIPPTVTADPGGIETTIAFRHVGSDEPFMAVPIAVR